jgi:hypothetical protein
MPIHKPEPLKGDLTGFWSRRINHEHRLVYLPEDKLKNDVEVLPFYTERALKPSKIFSMSIDNKSIFAFNG